MVFLWRNQGEFIGRDLLFERQQLSSEFNENLLTDFKHFLNSTQISQNKKLNLRNPSLNFTVFISEI